MKIGMRKIVCLACSAFLLLSLVGCFSKWTPPDGNWYCEELQIQVSFSGGDCFYILDDEKIPCDCINNRGSRSFFVLSQAFDVEAVPLATELFSAVNMEFTETQMIATEEHTKIEYIFVKVE